MDQHDRIFDFHRDRLNKAFEVQPIEYDFMGDLCVGSRYYEINDNADEAITLSKTYRKDCQKIATKHDLMNHIEKWKPFLVNVYYHALNITDHDLDDVIFGCQKGAMRKDLSRFFALILPYVFIEGYLISSQYDVPEDIALVQLLNSGKYVQYGDFLWSRYTLVSSLGE